MTEAGKFREPGRDGELEPGTSLWRKGLVYTTRGSLSHTAGKGYRIAAGYKKRISGTVAASFHDVYHRVLAVASRRATELTCAAPGASLRGVNVGHSWGPLGQNIATALVTMELQCRTDAPDPGEDPPTAVALRSSGGATMEELERLAPQRADEIYNEFDFTDPATPVAQSVTLSYGESIEPSKWKSDFQPFVHRAESAARSYHQWLRSLGEVSGPTLHVQRREWFLASESFVTVVISFSRS